MDELRGGVSRFDVIVGYINCEMDEYHWWASSM